MTSEEPDSARLRDRLSQWLRPTASPPTRLSAAVLWSAAAALTLAAAYGLLTWQLSRGTGLIQTFFDGVGADRSPLVERVTQTVDLTILHEDDRLPRRFFSVHWRGVWRIPRRGLYDISIRGDDRVVLTIDGHEVHTDSMADPAENPRTLPLGPGYHAIEVDFEQYRGTSGLRVAWAPAGGSPRPLNSASLFPVVPTYPRLRAVLESVRWMLGFLSLAALTLSIYRSVLALALPARRLIEQRIDPTTTRTIRRIVAAGMPILIVAYAAGLRFDAISLKYPVDRPGWLHTLQERSRAPLGALRPETVTWARIPDRPHRDGPPSLYISDPYTFLGFARATPHFYAAHHREPVFPFVTKVFLGLLDDQDVAVSFAAALFSILAVAATYLLEAYAFSHWVDLGAATLLAIEYNVISVGVDGWRDGALAVTMFAAALLHHSRVASKTSGVLLGVVAAFACLVRITSLTFLLPGFACLLLVSTRP